MPWGFESPLPHRHIVTLCRRRLHDSARASDAGSQPEPAKQIENLSPILVVDNQQSILTPNDADDCGVGAVEPVEHDACRTGYGPITKTLGVSAEQVGTRVLKRDRRAVIVKAVSSIIFFDVVPKAVKHAAKILRFLPVSVRHKLEQYVERKRHERDR